MSQHTLCAVMGNPIAHSLSPAIHELFAKQTNKNLTYVKICADSATFEQEVTEFFAKGGLGLNITQPFKTRAYQLSDCPTPRCQEAQAANTLWCKDHKIYAVFKTQRKKGGLPWACTTEDRNFFTGWNTEILKLVLKFSLPFSMVIHNVIHR